MRQLYNRVLRETEDAAKTVRRHSSHKPMAVAQLHRTIGNQAVEKLLRSASSSVIQRRYDNPNTVITNLQTIAANFNAATPFDDTKWRKDDTNKWKPADLPD